MSTGNVTFGWSVLLDSLHSKQLNPQRHPKLTARWRVVLVSFFDTTAAWEGDLPEKTFAATIKCLRNGLRDAGISLCGRFPPPNLVVGCSSFSV